jgi:hypothetical protein
MFTAKTSYGSKHGVQITKKQQTKALHLQKPQSTNSKVWGERKFGLRVWVSVESHIVLILILIVKEQCRTHTLFSLAISSRARRTDQMAIQTSRCFPQLQETNEFAQSREALQL